MPVFTAAAAFIAAEIGITSVMGIAAVNLGVRVLATYVVSDLMTKRSDPGSQAQQSQVSSGTRVQLSPATANKLQIVYGSAFISPIIIDAKISTDQKTMWYVMALSEATDNGSISFGRTWWGDKELSLTGPNAVQWTDTNGQTNSQCNNNLFVYYFNNGSHSPVNNTQSAIEILQDEQIAPADRWTDNHLMSNTAFAIVKIVFNQDASLTNLDQLKVQVINSINEPGTVVLDYLNNSRYGCAIPIENIDVDSLTALNTYSAQQISYTPAGGGALAYQNRYTINGVINTNNNCLTNLQQIMDACDSWLKWDEVNNKWAVIINRSYTDYTTYESLFVIDSDNIVGGVDVVPVDLNSTYNRVESSFFNNKTKDQSDYTYLTLPEIDMNPNEPQNILSMQLPLVNNSVQAHYLAVRRLIQSREDLIVNISMDYSGIQIEAGDIVRVAHPVYGWGPMPTNVNNPDKLFIVNQVVESKTEDGSLGARVSLFEYNEEIYQNIDIQDYVPESNTGIANPGWISQPSSPIVTTNTTPTADGSTSTFSVSGTVPDSGTILFMDFYYGTTTDASTYKLYKTLNPATGKSFTNGASVQITVNDLPAGTYFWSVRARSTQTSSPMGSTSNSHTWNGSALLPPALVGATIVGGIANGMVQNNAISYSNLAPNATGVYPFVKYDVRNSTPVLVTSTTYRNIPLIYPGVSVTSPNVFPWYQNTPAWSSTYGPAFAVNNGTNGWYAAIGLDVSSISIDPSEVFGINGYLNMLTDTPNTIVQVMLYYKFGTQTYYTAEQVNFQTHTIANTAPYPFQIPLTHISTVATSAREIGFLIRNLTVGSNVTIYAGGIGAKQNK
jgi:hypothetical protein